MIDIILTAIAFIILIVGTYTDFKTREVPDWVNYSGVAIGLGVRALYSAATFQWNYILSGIAGFAIFFVIALAMFYLGQWGGGDSKMLMGLGALIGFRPRPDAALIAFFINALIVGAIYGILWGVYLAVKNRKKFLPYVEKVFKSRHYQMAKWGLIACIIAAFIGAFIFSQNFPVSTMILGAALVVVLMFYLFIFFTAVEKTSMLKSVPIERLTEGDWIAKDVVVGGKRICGPKDLGISKNQIRKLLELKKKGKIRKVMIKEGMPFVPVFLTAYFIAVFFGNIVLFFI